MSIIYYYSQKFNIYANVTFIIMAIYFETFVCIYSYMKRKIHPVQYKNITKLIIQ